MVPLGAGRSPHPSFLTIGLLLGVAADANPLPEPFSQNANQFARLANRFAGSPFYNVAVAGELCIEFSEAADPRRMTVRDVPAERDASGGTLGRGPEFLR